MEVAVGVIASVVLIWCAIMLIIHANENESGRVSQAPDQPIVTAPHRPARMIMNEPDLDPRWEWIPVPEFGKRDPDYIKGPCRHTEMIPINAIDEETIAMHCLTCQQTFYRGSAA